MKRTIKALYAGTFDPITYGHIDVVKRALKLFDKVIVAIAVNASKRPLFTVEERTAFIKRAFRSQNNVEVVAFEGLVVDYAKKQGIKILIRGLRMVTDFDYEFQMAITNRKLAPEIETLFIMPSENFFYINSSLVKELVLAGGDTKDFVPDYVRKAIEAKLKKAAK